MNQIDLLLDEENELTFQLSVEGTRPAAAKCRLLLENDNMSLIFDAKEYINEEVNIVLPPLSHVLKEGIYDMSLEVIVDDRYFEPLSIKGNFEKRIKITAEAKVKPRVKKGITKATLLEVSNRSNKDTNIKKPKQLLRTKKAQKLKRKVTDNDIMKIIESLSRKK